MRIGAIEPFTLFTVVEHVAPRYRYPDRLLRRRLPLAHTFMLPHVPLPVDVYRLIYQV